ncbi:MAG: phosphotransferase [Bacteroidota bacterium]
MNFFLNADEPAALEAYLLDHKFIAPDEKIQSASKPGEGNMNYTLRIRTNFRSFIIKQSRDYVEKYPSIPAPRERAIIEGQFYELTQANPKLREFQPEIDAVDAENSIILLEDLGQSSDMTYLYKKEKEINLDDLRALIDYISELHNKFNTETTDVRISNLKMRELNAEHIFNYPFLEENGFDLDTITPGLQAVAMRYKSDAAFKAKIKDLSKHYLTDGKTLLHGDFYPGSWLRTIEGVRVIDPEFCFFGPAEFDLSVMIAHMKMAQQDESVEAEIMARYVEPKGFYTALMEQLVGIEIMRRLIGLAQLPLSLSLEEKESLLEEAYHLIMG